MLGCMNIDFLMDVNTKLLLDHKELFEDVRRYWRLMGTELPTGDQTEHHIHSQYSETVFVSTKDYPLKGSKEFFVVSE